MAFALLAAECREGCCGQDWSAMLQGRSALGIARLRAEANKKGCFDTCHMPTVLGFCCVQALLLLWEPLVDSALRKSQ